jgi:hypothetical protein
MDQQIPEHQLTPGQSVRLKCETPDCWVGDVLVTSKGGAVRHGPGCPHCQRPMRPQGDVIPAWDGE